jgi:hypothetical protein
MRYALPLVTCAALLAAGAAVRGGPQFTFDAINYAFVAEELGAGNGYRTPMYWVDPAGAPPDARGTTPFQLHPPLYPALLAAVGAGSEREAPGLALNVAAHVATSLLCLFMGVRLRGPRAGALAGFCVALAWPLLTAAGYLMAETVFTTCFVAAIAALVAARTSPHPTRWHALAAFCACVAIPIRYAGLGLVPLFAYEAAVRARRDDARTGLVAAAVLLPPPPLVFALCTLRGRTTSWDDPRTPFEALGQLATMGADTLATLHPAPILLALVAVPLLARDARPRRLRPDAPTPSRVALLPAGPPARAHGPRGRSRARPTPPSLGARPRPRPDPAARRRARRARSPGLDPPAARRANRRLATHGRRAGHDRHAAPGRALRQPPRLRPAPTRLPHARAPADGRR